MPKHSKLAASLAAVGLTLGLGACAADDADVPESADPGEVTAQVSPIAATPIIKSSQSHAEIFHWDNNTYWNIELRPVKTHICFLSQVSGLFDGNQVLGVHRDSHDLFLGEPDETSTVWKLGGFRGPTNTGLYGEATCVPLSDFKGPSGTVARFSKAAWAWVETNRPGCSGSSSVNLWKHGISYVGAVQGEFDGGGENVEILHEPFQTPRLRVSTQTCTHEEGYAYSFDVGVPGETEITNFGHYVVELHDDQTVKLDPTSTHICYFERISGSLDGGGERLRIYPKKDASGTEYWYAEAKAEGGSAYARVSCIAYDQTPVPVL